MSPSPMQVFVESRADQLLAEALLRPYAVEIRNGFTSSGAIADVQVSLLYHPERPVAVLLNAGTENEREVAEMRSSAGRLLAGCAPEGWYVALAIPRLDAWALTDPRIKHELDSHPAGREIYLDRAARIAQLLKRQPFNATELERTSPDFRGLIDFVRKHAPAAAG
jgi:hypothetical protein